MSRFLQYLITAVLVTSAIAISVAVVQRGYLNQIVHILFHDHTEPLESEGHDGQPGTESPEREQSAPGQQ